VGNAPAEKVENFVQFLVLRSNGIVTGHGIVVDLFNQSAGAGLNRAG
jgi:hypothetical protein